MAENRFLTQRRMAKPHKELGKRWLWSPSCSQLPNSWN